jgi:dipeptidyl aminopeptidase/acylaminoacyl peptidase
MNQNKLLLIAVIALASCKSGSENKAETDSSPREVAQYSIEQFYKSSGIYGGSISSDDKTMLVGSNESGIFNAFEIDLATGQRTALTNSTGESIWVNDYVPGTRNILFSSDKGGNENDHIFLKTAGGETKELTPWENAKSQFYGWSRDNKTGYFLSNKRNPQFFDLYKMDTATWNPVMIYQNDNGFEVGGMSSNEKYLALVESLTTSSNNLYLVDNETKKSTRINPEGSEGIYSPLLFSVDNNSMYYLTDEKNEYQYIIKYDIASGAKEKLYSTNWDVMFMNVSFNEKYRIIGVNEDGRNKIYLFDHKTGKQLDFPAVGNGDISSVGISKSENKMRLTIGDGASPNDIYVYDFGSKEMKRLTNSLNPEIKSEDMVRPTVVRYKSFDGLEIPAIYYKPHQAGPEAKVPAVVMVHGGPGGQARVGYFPLVQYLVNHGYAVIDVNNRGSSGYGKSFFKMDNRNHGDKDLKDVVWAKKYLQTLPYIDTAKIGVMGGSYGGYMTLAALCFHPDEFKAGVDIFGVANWLRTLKSVPPYWESFKKALYDELGDPNTADTVRLKAYSPLYNADKIKKPLMVLQGANDPRVLQVESDEIVAQVKKNNVPVEYVVFPDEGHGFVKKQNEIKGYGQIKEFLDKYLKGTPAPANKLN